MNIKKEILSVIGSVFIGFILSGIFNGFKEINITILIISSLFIYLSYQWKDKYPDSYEHFQKKNSTSFSFISKKDKEDIQGMKNFTNDLMNQIKLVDITKLKEVIIKNEKTIIEYDKNKHQDLIRLSKFLINIESTMQENFIDGTTFVDGAQEKFKITRTFLAYSTLKKNNDALTLMLKLSLTMIKKLINGEISEFIIIYEKFEEIGVFRSSFENELLEKLDELTNKLDSISEKLSKIDSKLGYQNLVLTYNTYQFHKIRKSVEK